MQWIKTKDERPPDHLMTILIWYKGDFEFGHQINGVFLFYDGKEFEKCTIEPEYWCKLPPSLD